MTPLPTQAPVLPDILGFAILVLMMGFFVVVSYALWRDL